MSERVVAERSLEEPSCLQFDSGFFKFARTTNWGETAMKLTTEQIAEFNTRGVIIAREALTHDD